MSPRFINQHLSKSLIASKLLLGITMGREGRVKTTSKRIRVSTGSSTYGIKTTHKMLGPQAIQKHQVQAAAELKDRISGK